MELSVHFSEHLCGDWIKKWLSLHVAYKREPGNGCELMSATCGKPRTVFRMELLIGHIGAMRREFIERFCYTIAVAVRLMWPWFQTCCVVREDSYFA